MDSIVETPTTANERQPVSAWRRRGQLPLFGVALAGISISVYLIYQHVEKSGFKHRHNLRTFRPVAAPFDLKNSILSREKIRSGGPPKDGIPALTAPKFVEASRATFMDVADKVVGITLGDKAKAYPLKILDYHEAVNDTVGGVPVAVTYCPLCDSSVVYDRRHNDRILELGISGLLYNSNVLLYDRGDPGEESLWSQMMSQSIAGPEVRQELKKLPLEVTTWEAWTARYPNTQVLSVDTGHNRRYDRSVYAHYFAIDDLMFNVEPMDERLPAKTPVLGVSVDNQHRAYPLSAFAESRQWEDQFAGQTIVLNYDADAKSLRVERASEGVEWLYAFWFAWAAFHPETEIRQLTGK